jgi:hypothetical protein
VPALLGIPPSEEDEANLWWQISHHAVLLLIVDDRSQGRFENPLTREALSREDCRNLDQ